MRRTHGSSPRAKEAAITEVVAAMVKPLGPSLIDVRDRAVLLIGFAGAMRRSELSALDAAGADVGQPDPSLTTGVGARRPVHPHDGIVRQSSRWRGVRDHDDGCRLPTGRAARRRAVEQPIRQVIVKLAATGVVDHLERTRLSGHRD